MSLLTDLLSRISIGYGELSGKISIEYFDLIKVFIFALLIALYAVFTWKFYSYVSKKDLINLNLRKYNLTTHPLANKIMATFLYLIEYIIILPFLIFFWFAVLAILILALSENLGTFRILVISAAMVAAIRMLSYYKEDLSRDLAKMFPFTLLAIFILSPNFFDLNRVLTNIATIPTFLRSIVLFLILIVALEVVLRVIDLIINISTTQKEAALLNGEE